MEDKILKKWRIISKNDDGSFGTVYKVASADGFICAIKKISLPLPQNKVEKLLNDGLSSLEQINNYVVVMFKNEVEIMKKFTGNAHIIDLYDVNYEVKSDKNFDYFIRMEYADDLKSYYGDSKISHEDVVKMAIDICSALELLEQNNIVHGDIKPNNIFVSDEGFKLGDFGSATKLGSCDRISFGTVNYMAPEVCRKEAVSYSTDLYSLGLVMYKLLKGKLPFVEAGTSLESAFNIRMSGKMIPNIEGVEQALMNIISKACSFNPNDRYSNSTEMKNDLLKLEGISNEKSVVSFVSNDAEPTISVYDKNLLDGQDNSNIIVKAKGVAAIKKKVLNPRFIKRAIGVLVLVLIAGGFYKVYSLNKGCDAGYINRNGKCVKGYYYCSSGYNLNADNKCQKTIESVEAKVTYTCKTGFTLTGDLCVSNDVKEPEFVYKCADGFTLKGTKCEKVETNDAVITYNCPSGYTRVDQACIKGDSIDATANYSCSSGYTLTTNSSGARVCSKPISSSSSVKATTVYTCSDGSKPNSSNKCARSYTVYSSYQCSGEYTSNFNGFYGFGGGTCTVYDAEPQKSYTCPANTKNNNNGTCTYTTSSSDIKEATVTYSCPGGYERVGSKCTTAETINGTPVYTCLDSQRREGKKCITTVTTDAVGMYACPDGFVASGVSCIQDEFPQPIKKYSCSRVYTLNSGMCEKYDILPAKEHYD